VFSVKPLESHLHPTIDSRICSQVLDVAVPRVADQAWICKNGWAKMLGLGFPGCGEQHYDQSVREIEIEIDRKKRLWSCWAANLPNNDDFWQTPHRFTGFNQSMLPSKNWTSAW
jgi:hypothetical protein